MTPSGFRSPILVLVVGELVREGMTAMDACKASCSCVVGTLLPCSAGPSR
jgi:hypothetical protein